MDCDRIARWYRWLEYATFGRALEHRRFEYLDSVTGARRVLMLGEGDGRFTAAYVRRSPHSEVDSIESSREMLRLARARVVRAVSFHHADARTFPLESGHYDLIVTHFFLDCFSTDECAAIIGRISEAAAPAAQWLISEFHRPSSGFSRLWTGPLIRFCYFGFRLTTGLRVTHLPDYRDKLEACGFTCKRNHMSFGGLLTSELWER